MQQDEGNKYAKATMDIAKKFGLPMLNEWNDPNVPLLTQTGRIDVSADIRAIRDTTFKVSSTNRHPNWQAQEYESTIVEDFIRSL